MLIGLISFFGILRKNKIFWLRFLQLATFLGACVAVYHSGILLGWIKDPCIVQKVSSVVGFKQMLISQIPCSQKAVSLFGIAIPFYNCVVFSGIGVFSLLFSKKLAYKR